MEIYRRKNLAEDVLMTGAEQSGLICVSHQHQLWFTFQDWLKVYGNITCWVISSRPTDCRDLEDDCIAFCYWYTLGHWVPVSSSPVSWSEVKRPLNIVNFNYHITFCIGYKPLFTQPGQKMRFKTLFLTFNTIYEISFIRSRYSHLDFSTELCQLHNLG